MRNPTKRKVTAALLMSVTFSGSILPAQAQQAVPSSETVEEIVVTALRRDQTLQTTPMSISAITGVTLQDQGIGSVDDYYRQVPNLNVSQGSPNNQRVSIRGVQSAGEPTVGIYYDETPVTGPAGSSADSGSRQPDLNVFDVQRIEVLRGPQGTLYGGSSMGGAIRVIFNKPDASALDGMAETSFATTKEGGRSYMVRGMVNVPVGEKMAARVTGWTDTRGGYIDNVVLGGENINRKNTRGVRAAVGFEPNDNIDIVASAIHQYITYDDSVSYWYEARGQYATDARTRGIYQNTLNLANVTANIDLPFAALTLTTSRYIWDILDVNDYTTTLNSGVTNAASCRAYHGITTTCTSAQLATYQAYARSRIPGNFYQPSSLHSWNNEARMSSVDEGPLKWTVGAYWEHRTDHLDSLVYRTDAMGKPIDNVGDETGYRYINTTLKQIAGFGEISYTVFDSLTFTAGARRYDYKKIVNGAVEVANILTGSTKSPFEEVAVDATGWVTKLNIDYQATPDLLLFVSRGEGFRPGGANNTAGIPNTLLPYNPDSLVNYEAGVKASWLQRRLTTNLSVYQNNWSDMQIQATSTNGAFRFITNAGAARIRGFEAEVNARVMEGLDISGSLGYTDAKLTEDQVNSLILLAASSGRAGDRLPNVPKWTGSASVSYTWPAFGEYSGMVRADYTYTGTQGSELRPTSANYTLQDPYSIANARVGLQNDNFGVFVYINNLAGDVVMRNTRGTGFVNRLTSVTPRTVGINFRLSM